MALADVGITADGEGVIVAPVTGADVGLLSVALADVGAT